MMHQVTRFTAALIAAFSVALLAAWPASAGAGGFGHRGGHHGHHYGGYGGYRRHYYPPYRYGGHLSLHGHGSGYGLALAIPLAAIIASSYAYAPRAGTAPRYRVVEPARLAPAPAAPRCRQTREYQTRIIIDGEEVDAYGTACLKADGSWERAGLNLAR